MSVTDGKKDTGSFFHSRNTDLKSLGELLIAAITPEKPNYEYIRQAKSTAEICGRCGCKLSASDTVYIRKFFIPAGRLKFQPSYWTAPVCESCAPKRRAGYIKAPCDCCSRLVVFPHTGRDERRRFVHCSELCQRKAHNRYHSNLRKLHTAMLREKVCEVCGQSFTATRRDAKTCSKACKQKAYRQRKNGGAA